MKQKIELNQTQKKIIEKRKLELIGDRDKTTQFMTIENKRKNDCEHNINTCLSNLNTINGKITELDALLKGEIGEEDPKKSNKE